jgi:hypothetical protein
MFMKEINKIIKDLITYVCTGVHKELWLKVVRLEGSYTSERVKNVEKRLEKGKGVWAFRGGW